MKAIARDTYYKMKDIQAMQRFLLATVGRPMTFEHVSPTEYRPHLPLCAGTNAKIVKNGPYWQIHSSHILALKRSERLPVDEAEFELAFLLAKTHLGSNLFASRLHTFALVDTLLRYYSSG